MKQKKIIKEIYKACIDHDDERLAELRIEEFAKIIKHKAEGKAFTTKWAVVQL
jgi:hypothetical protein